MAYMIALVVIAICVISGVAVKNHRTKQKKAAMRLRDEIKMRAERAEKEFYAQNDSKV